MNCEETTTPDYQKLYEVEKNKVEQLNKLLQVEKIKAKKMMNAQINGKVCQKCLEVISPDSFTNQRPSAIMEDFKNFSEKIEGVLAKTSKIGGEGGSRHARTHTNEDSARKSIRARREDTTSLAMIDNFTVFGVSQDIIRENAQSRKSEGIEPELLYSVKTPSEVDEQAIKLIFPSGIALKAIRGQKARDKAIQMMSFCYTNLKSFVLRFKKQENVNDVEYEKNPFLIHLNPEKALYCLCIGINDYTTASVEGNIARRHNNSLKFLESQFNLPSNMKIDEVDVALSDKKNSYPSERGSIQMDNTLCIVMSQRVFCISSYYPFLTFYQEILRNLINIVKMERLVTYRHQNEDITETDSAFQLNRMKELFGLSMNDLNQKIVSFNRSYSLKLINHQKLVLITDWALAKSYFIEEWVFTVLNMFTIDTFIDLLTLVMLEDHIVFICENSHILTYTIYLFSSILIRPFVYAYQVVSIIPEEDFLGAPFPVMYGLLKKKKYVEQSSIFQDYKNTYIYLNPEKIQFVFTESRKSLLKCKPSKLKNQLSPLFKDLKKYRRGDQKSAKYEIEVAEYAISSMGEQRETAVSIVEAVNEFILQEIINKLPNQIEINKIRNSIDLENLPQQKDENTYLMDQIKVLVKRNTKDPFLDKVLETQMITQYLLK